MMRYAHIAGWGCYLPDRVVTNDELSQIVDTSDEWIYQRTGIRTRRIASSHETTATMAFETAARALATADLHPSQVDLIIVATSTPESMFPASACLVQDYLGATHAAAFDLSAETATYAPLAIISAGADGRIDTGTTSSDNDDNLDSYRTRVSLAGQ